MTTTKTAAPSDESLSALISRLQSASLARPLIDAVIDRIRKDEAEATAKAARLYFRKDDHERISRFDFDDQLHEIARRAYGVAAAVSSIGEVKGDPWTNGARQLSDDLARDLKRLAEAYSAEGTIDFLAEKDREPVSGPALCLAFLKCNAARQAILRHKGPGDLPEALVDAEGDALMAVALCRCKADDVSSKLRYLLHHHKKASGDDWPGAGSPWIMAAIDLHFGQGWTDRANAAAWRADIGMKAISDEEPAELLKDPAIAEALDKIGGQ